MPFSPVLCTACRVHVPELFAYPTVKPCTCQLHPRRSSCRIVEFRVERYSQRHRLAHISCTVDQRPGVEWSPELIYTGLPVICLPRFTPSSPSSPSTAIYHTINARTWSFSIGGNNIIDNLISPVVHRCHIILYLSAPFSVTVTKS